MTILSFCSSQRALTDLATTTILSRSFGQVSGRVDVDHGEQESDGHEQLDPLEGGGLGHGIDLSAIVCSGPRP